MARYFGRLGVETACAVGLDGAARASAASPPDIVLCDYDLLATESLEPWEHDPRLANIPVIAVSLTRRPEEAHLRDVNGIAGFLYLPTLRMEDARRVLGAARPPADYRLPSPFLGTAPRATAPQGL